MRPASATTVSALPDGPGWWYEPEYAGERILLLRERPSGTDGAGVRLLDAAGRNVTAAWPEVTGAAAGLRPGTVLDGAAVFWRAGRLDPAAARARAAGEAPAPDGPPAGYAPFDLLAHPDHGDVRDLGYAERRLLLLDLLEDAGPALRPVPATDDHGTALFWYESLREQGVPGVLAKPADAPYRAGEGSWLRLRQPG